MMTNPNSPSLPMYLNYLQLDRRIPHSNAPVVGPSPVSGMDLSIKSIDLYVDVDPAIATWMNPSTDDSPNWNLAHGGPTWPTVAHYHINTAASIALFVDRSHDLVHLDQYFFTFDPLVLNDPQYIVSHDMTYNFSSFLPEQRYRLKVIYGVCGNIENTSNGLINSIISNTMWLSGIKQPFDASEQPNAQQPNTRADLCTALPSLQFPQFPCSTTATDVTQANFADKYLFYCETCGNMHFFVSNNLGHNVAVDNLKDPCERDIHMRTISFLGENDPHDYFKYEFRPPPQQPDYWLFTMPSGFSYQAGSASFKMFYSTSYNYSSNYTTPVISFNPPFPSIFAFNKNSLVSSNPIECLEFMAPPPITPVINDNRLVYDMDFTIEPTTCISGSTAMPNLGILVGFTDVSSDCSAANGAQCNISITKESPNVNEPAYPGSLTIVPNNPNLIIQAYGYNPGTLSLNIPINISNSNGGDAHFAFIAMPSPLPCNIAVGGITLDGPAGTIPLNNNIFELGIIPVGTLNYTCTLKISLNPCVCLPTTNPIHFIYGWNCKSYPTYPVNPTNICYTTTFDVPILLPSIAVDPQPDPTYTPNALILCSPFHYKARFKNTGQGAILPAQITLNNLAPGLKINSIVIDNPDAGCTAAPVPITQVGTSNVYSINNTDLTTLCYPQDQYTLKYYLAPLDELFVDVELEAGCNYNTLITNYGPDIILTYGNLCSSISYSSELYGGTAIPALDPLMPSLCTDCITLTKTAAPIATLPGLPVQFDVTACINTLNNSLATNSVNVALTDLFPLPADFFITNNPNSFPINFTLTQAAPCTTLTVNGYFNTEGNCTDGHHTNTAIALVNQTTTFTARRCVDVGCDNVQLSQPAFTTVTDATALIALNGGLNLISNQILHFNENLIIDQTLTFDHCGIIMDAGKEIIIPQGAGTFTVEESTLIGCGGMWPGIRDETDNQLIINKSRIRDANEAIHFEGIGPINGLLRVTDSEITECVNGIVTPLLPTGYHNIHSEITGTIFGLKNATVLKHPYSGQPICFLSRPRTGIEFNSMVSRIGSRYLFFSPNQFYNMSTGIIGKASSLAIENCAFYSIMPPVNPLQRYFTPNQNYPRIDGTPIASYSDPGYGSSTLNLISLPVATGILIDGCLTGVYNEYSHLNTAGGSVHIYNCVTGFSCLNNSIQTIGLSGTVIRASLCGINMVNNAGAPDIQVSFNNITISGNIRGQGIVMTDFQPQISSNYRVSGNTITLIDGSDGIFSQGVFKPIIEDNIIDQNPANGNTLISPNNGINLNASEGAEVKCNTITSNYLNITFGTIGMSVNGCLSYQVYCNKTNKHYNGFYFGGDCTASNDNFKGNEMNANYTGLYLNNMAKIGIQNLRGNLWNGNAGPWGAENQNNSALGVNASEFKVNNNPPIELPIIWPGQISGWFNITQGPIYTCGTDCNYNGGGSGSLSNIEYNRSVARDSVTTVDYIPEGKSIAKGNLNEQLHEDSVLLNSDTVLINFYNQNQNSSVGKLYDTKKKLSESASISPAQAELLYLADSLKHLKMDSIILIDSLNQLGLLNNYLIIRQNLLNSISALQQSINFIVLQMQQYELSDLNSADSINLTVITQELPEENSRFINQMYILYKTFGRDTLLSYWNQIVATAQQCPYSGGNAVYIARNFVALFTDSISYTDLVTCLQNGIYRNSNQGSVFKSNNVSIIPNPANEKIDIYINSKEISICKIQIISIYGSLIMEKDINCNEHVVHSISTVELTPGAYFIKVKQNNMLINISKIIIQR